MDDRNLALILTLAKVLVATAWADGDLSSDEINSMKRDLLTRVPNLSTQQWASVAIYMDSPVDEAERMRLVEQLRSRATSPAGKQLVFDALDDLVAADGRISDEERRVVDDTKAAIEAGSVGSLGGVSRLFGRRATAQPPADQPANREAYLDEFVNNRVYYVVCRRLEQGGIVPRLSDAEIRKLCLAGGMMAVVAHAETQVTDAEKASMTAILQQHWNLDGEQAGFLIDVAVSQLPSDLDRFELARAFTAVSDDDERGRLVDAFFAVAAADGTVVVEEVETIRGLAKGMLLTHERFIEAKLKAMRP